jgi:hypothetical protein
MWDMYIKYRWEKVQEILTWLVVWAPAVAIWAFTKVSFYICPTYVLNISHICPLQ